MKIHPPYPDYPYFRANEPLESIEYAVDCSILAYETPDYIKKVMQFSAMTVDVITTALFQCFVCNKYGMWLVAFRGTLGIYDWMDDLKVEKTAEGFHQGFYDAVEDLLPQLKILVAGKDVILTGHSLGAAEAVVAAYRLQGSCNPISIINFGQPKIGNQQAVDKLKGIPWVRYVHGTDIVTQVPLKAMDYVHGGVEVQLPQTPRPWRQAFSLERPYYFPLSLWDHVPTLYAEQIWGGVQ